MPLNTTLKNLKLKHIFFIISFVFIFPFSTACDSRQLTYEGQEAHAAWRVKAETNIEKIRKSFIKIKLKDSEGRPIKNASIRVRMKRHAFGFGSAVGARQLMGKEKAFDSYRKTVLESFNKVVLENDLKMDAWEASKTTPPGSKYNIQQTFAALNWLKDNHIEVRGHYGSWGRVNSAPFYKKHKNRPLVFRDILFSHIREKIPAVGKLVSEWDAVNHPLGIGLTPTLIDVFGPQIYIDVFALIKRLNPDAALYLNDHELLSPVDENEDKQNQYERLIRYLLRNNAPIDGIGFMGHFDDDCLRPPKELLKILDRFSVFGLPIQITEFDIRFGKIGKQYNFNDAELKLQADYTRDFMTAVFSHPSVNSMIMWGFWEGRHWYPSAALYRMDWSIKPNGLVWKNLVFKKWWTNVQGKTDKNGEYFTRAFLGDHIIEITDSSQTRQLAIALSKEGLNLDVTMDHPAQPSVLNSIPPLKQNLIHADISLNQQK